MSRSSATNIYGLPDLDRGSGPIISTEISWKMPVTWIVSCAILRPKHVRWRNYHGTCGSMCIVQWLRSRCPLCKKLEGEKTGRKIAHETIQVTGIFQEISVDMIGPLPLSKSGNPYVLVAIDSFARFLFLRACRSTGAEEMARWIVE
jgi:hypothetical protein